MARTGSTEMADNQDNTAVVPKVSTVPNDTKKPGLLKRLKDREYRNKVMHTMYLALTFIALGLVVGQIGPTFLDLQLITGTDLEKASAFFTGGSIGYLTGSVIAGSLYNRVNKNFLMFSGAFGLGIVNSLTAYCKPYALMIFIRCACGVGAGFVDTAGNSEQMRIWGTEGHSLMQLLHFAFALGGVISPLYTAPFLAVREDDGEKNVLTRSNFTSDNFTNILVDGNITSFVHESNATNVTSIALLPETNVHIAYLITGVATVLSGIPFFIFFILDMVRKRTEKSKKEVKVTQRKLPLPVFLFVLISLCLFYLLYCCVEDTFASFLMTFLVREYSNVSKAKGAYITAIYWASFAVSRFLMIFLSKLLSAVRLLYLCCGLMIIAFSSFIISAVAGSVIALSFFAAMAGLSMSGVFPSGFLWTETELLRVTGPISSCILISASLGTMINPLILGYLMKELSNMWFCYLLVLETFMVSAVFIFLLNFNRHFINKHYGSLNSPTLELTVNAEEQESRQPLSAVGDGKGVENGSV